MWVPFLKFESGPMVPLLNFEVGSWVPFLNLRGGSGSGAGSHFQTLREVPGLRFQGPRGPGSRGPGSTFRPGRKR